MYLQNTIGTDLKGLGPIISSCTSAKSSTCEENNMKNLVVKFNFFKFICEFQFLLPCMDTFALKVGL